MLPWKGSEKSKSRILYPFWRDFLSRFAQDGFRTQPQLCHLPPGSEGQFAAPRRGTVIVVLGRRFKEQSGKMHPVRHDAVSDEDRRTEVQAVSFLRSAIKPIGEEVRDRHAAFGLLDGQPI